MKAKTIYCFFIALIVISANALERVPVAVSPGSDAGVAGVRERCPTFSWTSVEWAAAYRVAVFEAVSTEELPYEEMEAVASPVLSKEIQGHALSWTPSSDEWLGNGGLYIWYVQAKDTYGTARWSQGKVFKVEVTDRVESIGETLGRTLREYGMSEEAIVDVLRKTASAIEDRDSGDAVLETSDDKATVPIGIQGNEAGSNTYYGEGAGASLTSGINNSFFGYHAGNKTDTGIYNTCIGFGAGEDNTGGECNTFVGMYAGYSNTASDNTFIGRDSGAYHTTGNYNTAIGTNSGSNSAGNYNIFIGNSSGAFNVADNNTFIGSQTGLNNTADNNTFIGYYSGRENTSGAQNTFIGHQAGKTNEVGLNNTFVGYQAGMNNTASHNTFLGRSTGELNTTGESNTFLGHSAGYKNTTGQKGTFVGRAAGYNNDEGDYNTIMGYYAGYNNDGSYNTFIGHNAGYTNSTGDGNIFLGHNAGYYEAGSYKLHIDNSSTSSPLVWGDFSNDILTVHGKFGVGTKSPAYKMELETTGENAAFVLQRIDGATNYVNATGGFGNFGTVSNHPLRMAVNGVWRMRLDPDNSLTMANGAGCTAVGVWKDASSRKYKENIHDLTVSEAMAALEGLNPVKYNYKKDQEDEYVGFIAEDVPELVASKDRKTMSPMDVVAVLTKVVQEQQKLAEKQQKTIDTLKKRIDEFEQRKHKLPLTKNGK